MYFFLFLFPIRNTCRFFKKKKKAACTVWRATWQLIFIQHRHFVISFLLKTGATGCERYRGWHSKLLLSNEPAKGDYRSLFKSPALITYIWWKLNLIKFDWKNSVKECRFEEQTCVPDWMRFVLWRNDASIFLIECLIRKSSHRIPIPIIKVIKDEHGGEKNQNYSILKFCRDFLWILELFWNWTVSSFIYTIILHS